MNAAVAQLDRFLREADPTTARTVEQIILNMLSLRVPGGEKPPGIVSSYRLPSRRLKAQAGLDLTKLAHVDDDR